MKYSNQLFYLLLLFSVVCYSCSESTTYVYDVNESTVLQATAGKDKLKTPEQYTAIVFTNLFQRPLAANELYDISAVMKSVGDKDLVQEVVLSNFMNKPDVILPSNEVMRSDVGKFIDETYERFFIRAPTEIEKEYFIRYINSHPNLEPEHVYFSFAISNEYQFY